MDVPSSILGVGFFEVKVFLDGHHLRMFQSHALFSSRGIYHSSLLASL
jgi:hypothetical protein